MQQPPQFNQPPQYQPQQPLPLNWIDIERARVAAGKSYTNKAMFTLLLYIFLWVPGLIANLLYLYEAYQTKQLTGTSPDGYGCLWTLLIVAVSPAMLICLVFFLTALGSALR